MKEETEVDDLSFDDDDLMDDDFGDFDDLDMEFNPPPDNRHPVIKIADNIGSSYVSNLVDPAAVVKSMKKALPDDIQTSIDTVDTVFTNAKDLYHKTISDVKPTLKNFKRSARTFKKALGDVLPKGLSDWIDSKLEDDDGDSGYRAPTEEEIRENQVQNTLLEVFKKQEEAEAERDKHDQVMEMAKMDQEGEHLNVSGEILKSINKLVANEEQLGQRYKMKMLEFTMRSWQTQAALLKSFSDYRKLAGDALLAIQKNTALPDIAKEQKAEVMKDVALRKFASKTQEALSSKISGSGMLNRIFDQIKRSMKEKVDAFNEGLSMVADTLDNLGSFGGGDGAMGAGNPLHDMIFDMAGGQLASFTHDKLSRQARKLIEENPTLMGMAAKAYRFNKDLGFNLADYVRNGLKSKETDVWWKKGLVWTGNKLRDTFELDNISTRESNLDIAQTTTQNILNRAEFNNYTQKSIVEIIPGYLARILASTEGIRTGKPQDLTLFDIARDTFVSKSQKKKDTLERYKSEAVSFNNKLDDNIKNLFGENHDLEREEVDQIKRLMLRKSRGAEKLDVLALAEDKDTTLSTKAKSLLKKTLKEKYNYTGKIDNRDAWNNKKLYEMEANVNDLVSYLPTSANKMFDQAKYGTFEDLDILKELNFVRNDGQNVHTSDMNAVYEWMLAYQDQLHKKQEEEKARDKLIQEGKLPKIANKARKIVDSNEIDKLADYYAYNNHQNAENEYRATAHLQDAIQDIVLKITPEINDLTEDNYISPSSRLPRTPRQGASRAREIHRIPARRATLPRNTAMGTTHRSHITLDDTHLRHLPDIAERLKSIASSVNQTYQLLEERLVNKAIDTTLSSPDILYDINQSIINQTTAYLQAMQQLNNNVLMIARQNVKLGGADGVDIEYDPNYIRPDEITSNLINWNKLARYGREGTKKLLDLGATSYHKAKAITAAVYNKAKSGLSYIGRPILNTIKSAASKLLAEDLYFLGNMTEPAIRAKNFALGLYTDSKGKVIRTLADVKDGIYEMREIAGEMKPVLIASLKDLSENMVDALGNKFDLTKYTSIGKKILSGIIDFGRNNLGFLNPKTIWQNAKNFAKQSYYRMKEFAMKDVYIGNEKHPRITGIQLMTGAFICNGKPLYRVKDIVDDVYDRNGQLVVGIEEIRNKGVFDSTGKPYKDILDGALSKIGNISATVLGLGKAAWNKAKQIGKGLLGGVSSIFKGLLGDFSFSLDINSKWTKRIYELLVWKFKGAPDEHNRDIKDDDIMGSTQNPKEAMRKVTQSYNKAKQVWEDRDVYANQLRESYLKMASFLDKTSIGNKNFTEHMQDFGETKLGKLIKTNATKVSDVVMKNANHLGLDKGKFSALINNKLSKEELKAHWEKVADKGEDFKSFYKEWKTMSGQQRKAYFADKLSSTTENLSQHASRVLEEASLTPDQLRSKYQNQLQRGKEAISTATTSARRHYQSAVRSMGDYFPSSQSDNPPETLRTTPVTQDHNFDLAHKAIKESRLGKRHRGWVKFERLPIYWQELLSNHYYDKFDELVREDPHDGLLINLKTIVNAEHRRRKIEANQGGYPIGDERNQPFFRKLFARQSKREAQEEKKQQRQAKQSRRAKPKQPGLIELLKQGESVSNATRIIQDRLLEKSKAMKKANDADGRSISRTFWDNVTENFMAGYNPTALKKQQRKQEQEAKRQDKLARNKAKQEAQHQKDIEGRTGIRDKVTGILRKGSWRSKESHNTNKSKSKDISKPQSNKSSILGGIFGMLKKVAMVGLPALLFAFKKLPKLLGNILMAPIKILKGIASTLDFVGRSVISATKLLGKGIKWFGTGAFNLIKSVASGASIAGKAIYSAGSLAVNAIKTQGVRGAIVEGAKFAGKRIAGSAAVAAISGGVGEALAIMTPVGWAVLAAAGVGYLAYRAWKAFHENPSPVEEYRMATYGIQWQLSTSDANKVLALEKHLDENTKINPKTGKMLKPNLDMRKWAAFFWNEVTDGELNEVRFGEEQLPRFKDWYEMRFLPSFTRHKEALYAITSAETTRGMETVDGLYDIDSDLMNGYKPAFTRMTFAHPEDRIPDTKLAYYEYDGLPFSNRDMGGLKYEEVQKYADVIFEKYASDEKMLKGNSFWNYGLSGLFVRTDKSVNDKGDFQFESNFKNGTIGSVGVSDGKMEDGSSRYEVDEDTKRLLQGAHSASERFKVKDKKTGDITEVSYKELQKSLGLNGVTLSDWQAIRAFVYGTSIGMPMELVTHLFTLEHEYTTRFMGFEHHVIGSNDVWFKQETLEEKSKFLDKMMVKFGWDRQNPDHVKAFMAYIETRFEPAVKELMSVWQDDSDRRAENSLQFDAITDGAVLYEIARDFVNKLDRRLIANTELNSIYLEPDLKVNYERKQIYNVHLKNLKDGVKQTAAVIPKTAEERKKRADELRQRYYDELKKRDEGLKNFKFENSTNIKTANTIDEWVPTPTQRDNELRGINDGYDNRITREILNNEAPQYTSINTPQQTPAPPSMTPEQLKNAKPQQRAVAQEFANQLAKTDWSQNEKNLFLANVSTETGDLAHFAEFTKYSNFSRLKEVYPKTYKKNPAALEAAWKAGSVELFNYLYNNENKPGLGNTQPGDGYRYRGRGGIQITGRALYDKIGKMIGQDIISNPDSVATDPKLIASTAIAYWNMRKKENKRFKEAIEANNIVEVRKAVNGATEGLKVMKEKYAQYTQGKGIVQQLASNAMTSSTSTTAQPTMADVGYNAQSAPAQTAQANASLDAQATMSNTPKLDTTSSTSTPSTKESNVSSTVKGLGVTNIATQIAGMAAKASYDKPTSPSVSTSQSTGGSALSSYSSLEENRSPNTATNPSATPIMRQTSGASPQVGNQPIPSGNEPSALQDAPASKGKQGLQALLARATPELVELGKSRIKVKEGVVLQGIKPDFLKLLYGCIGEYCKSNPNAYFEMTDGFRTKEYQQALYNRYLSGCGPLAAKPGSSRHEYGEAVDLSNAGHKNLKDGPVNHWFNQGNASEWGFIRPAVYQKNGLYQELWHIENRFFSKGKSTAKVLQETERKVLQKSGQSFESGEDYKQSSLPISGNNQAANQSASNSHIPPSSGTGVSNIGLSISRGAQELSAQAQTQMTQQSQAAVNFGTDALFSKPSSSSLSYMDRQQSRLSQAQDVSNANTGAYTTTPQVPAPESSNTNNNSHIPPSSGTGVEMPSPNLSPSQQIASATTQAIVQVEVMNNSKAEELLAQQVKLQQENNDTLKKVAEILTTTQQMTKPSEPVRSQNTNKEVQQAETDNVAALRGRMRTTTEGIRKGPLKTTRV